MSSTNYQHTGLETYLEAVPDVVPAEAPKSRVCGPELVCLESRYHGLISKACV